MSRMSGKEEEKKTKKKGPEWDSREPVQLGELRGGPPWLAKLLSTKFFRDCPIHVDQGDHNRQLKYFCIDCCDKLDPSKFASMDAYCTGLAGCVRCAEEHLGHRVLQACIVSCRPAIKVEVIQQFLDVTGIYQYRINNDWVVFLRERFQDKFQPGSAHCEACKRILPAGTVCSIACKATVFAKRPEYSFVPRPLLKAPVSIIYVKSESSSSRRRKGSSSDSSEAAKKGKRRKSSSDTASTSRRSKSKSKGKRVQQDEPEEPQGSTSDSSEPAKKGKRRDTASTSRRSKSKGKGKRVQDEPEEPQDEEPCEEQPPSDHEAEAEADEDEEENEMIDKDADKRAVIPDLCVVSRSMPVELLDAPPVPASETKHRRKSQPTRSLFC